MIQILIKVKRERRTSINLHVELIETRKIANFIITIYKCHGVSLLKHMFTIYGIQQYRNLLWLFQRFSQQALQVNGKCRLFQRHQLCIEKNNLDSDTFSRTIIIKHVEIHLQQIFHSFPVHVSRSVLFANVHKESRYQKVRHGNPSFWHE